MTDILQNIRKLKKKYEREWLAIPGVTAVGIGTMADGEIGIIVSVAERPERVREKIPARVAEVSVEIRESGALRAL